MKNKLFVLVLIIILVLIICSFLFQKNICKTIDIDNTKCKIVKTIDTHGGFNGDGDYFAKIKYSRINYKKLSNNWKKLPLPLELTDVMRMNQCNDDGCKSIYKKYSIPNIKNGYYYFLDRHSESKNKYDPSNLNNRLSMNFTLAIMDTNKNIIYYYELDT